MKNPLNPLWVAAALAALPFCSPAGIVTFAEYDGMADNTALPTDPAPAGLPDGITATWTGFSLHTTAGDTPMSIFPASEVAGGDDALIRFSGPVVVGSINVLDTSWGGPTNGAPLTVVGRRWGVEIWRYTSPDDHNWQKVTLGAGKEIDTLAFEGQFNHYDDISVEAAPDTDGDGYTDADEKTTGHDPNDPADNPTTKAIADSVAQFTTTGIQGENDWYYGYRDLTKDGGALNYDPVASFIEFPPESWTGSMWDMNTSGAPWTELGPRNIHPNAGTGDTHWPIRRWVANSLTKVTPLAIRWHIHHVNVSCGGNGVTGLLLVNGQVLDKAVIAGPDNVGVTHTFYLNAKPGDRIDLALSAKGVDGIESDGCDGSEDYFLVDPTIPADPRQPDASIFVPVGSGDADNDGLPDVWEKNYFPGDLTKLSATGDYDKDGLSDLGEYQRGSDPTKADSDGDGINDLAETGTGKYVSKADTGSSPTKVDTDGDGFSDFDEVNRTPPTDPNKADTDGDGVTDADEIAWGTDPLNAKDYPLAFVIANSQAQFSGVQGQNGWYYGYHIYDPATTNLDYNPTQDFVRFVGGAGQGDWDGINQTWTGDAWDLNTAGDGPWTFENALDVHPNGANSPSTFNGSPDPTNEQWVTRRWVANQLTSNTTATIIWQVKKTNLNGDGVTGLLFINGKLVDTKAIAGTDGKGEIRRYRATLKPTDIVDLALSPVAPSGAREDWSDGSQTWFWIDARPVAAQIKIASPSMDLVQGKFTLKWNSQAGAKYTISVSPNLVDWTQLPSVDSGGTETSWTETLPAPRPSARFYRVSQQ